MSDETTDAVAEAKRMIADFEVILSGRTSYVGMPGRQDVKYHRNRIALVARIEDLEAKLAAANQRIAELEQQRTVFAGTANDLETQVGALQAELAVAKKERGSVADALATTSRESGRRGAAIEAVRTALALADAPAVERELAREAEK